MGKSKELFIEQREREELQSSQNATARIESHNTAIDDYDKMKDEIDKILRLPNRYNMNWKKRDRILEIVKKYKYK